MTTAAETSEAAKAAAKTSEAAKAAAISARNADMEKREKELNAGKTGKGTRTFRGMTLGRNPL